MSQPPILTFRHKEILNFARASGRVSVDGLAEELHVTPQTVRRDLNFLCDHGQLTRIHGGAVLESSVANMAYTARRSIAASQKEAIGALCAAAIPDDASLFINIGTTTEATARALRRHRGQMVITNNLNIANILAENPHCDVVVTGGMLRRSDGGLVGESTVETVQQFRADYAVIGVSAIDEDGALLDFDYREVQVAKAIIANARHVFLVADNSKLTRSAPIRIGHISQVSAYFTDQITSNALRDVCLLHGVDIHETTPQTP